MAITVRVLSRSLFLPSTATKVPSSRLTFDLASPQPRFALARYFSSSLSLFTRKVRRGGSFLPFIAGEEHEVEAGVEAIPLPLPPDPSPLSVRGHGAETDPEKRAAAIAAALPLVARVSHTLDEVAKLELFTSKSAEEVTELWRAYHASRYCIAAVIPIALYKSLRDRWRKYPLFVLPLPRGQGAEFFVMQFVVDEDVAGLTSLRVVQRDGAARAPRALTMKHYTELSASHGLVLMRGEIDPHALDVQEAQLLANQLQLFYLDPQRYALVQKFHLDPQRFDYQSLLEVTLPKDNVVKAEPDAIK